MKMKKNAIVVLILLFVLSLFCGTSAQADYEGDEYIDFGEVKRLEVIDLNKIPYGQKPINKLDRGLINLTTFWMELPGEMAKVSNEQNPLLGVTVGTVQGLFASVVRAGSGLFDTVTFFVPPYDKPIVKPEYAYNRADEEMRELFW
jgi:putative exosortase-associated protein (TIGR04073 family)